jgi:flagellar basal-body rod modification protein FlgD
MNALVGIGANSGGLYSASPEKRLAVRREVQSMARAALLGKAKAMAKAREQAAAAAGAAPKSRSADATKAAEDGSETDNETQDPATRAVNNELGKDTFLQLLVKQMQNQDPLEPVDNTQMIAQLAQFSSLEQMSNLNDQFSVVSGNIDQLNFISANSLLGRRITGLDVEGEEVQGEVSRVFMQDSLVYLTVGEQLVSMAGVMSIDGMPVESESK